MASCFARSAYVRISACLFTAAIATAQVPDGYVVWGSFLGAAGQNGVYFSHPRDTTAAPIAVTGLTSALAYIPTQTNRGAASVLRRPSDDALIVGEHSPAGTSVDVHLLTLDGAQVIQTQLFSVGVSVVEGEIPQMGLLADGRIVLAGTDLAAGGALAHSLTPSFNWQGVGILDTTSGVITPIPISNLNQFTEVINGLAVSHDGQTVYLTNWISTVSGDLWSVPITGGTATLLATLPAPGSNITVDLDGSVLVTTLNGPPNLFRYDPVTQATTTVPTTTGPLNAVAVETVTGNYVLATANAGLPVRSLAWMEPNGPQNLLLSPDRGTISAVSINPNPERYGAGTPGVLSYDWQLLPNPAGLPENGNLQFSLTLEASQSTTAPALFVMSLASSAPTQLFGLSVLVDLTVTYPVFTMLTDTATLPFPLPPGPGLVGIEVFAQGFVYENASNTLAASSGVALTIL